MSVESLSQGYTGYTTPLKYSHSDLSGTRSYGGSLAHLSSKPRRKSSSASRPTSGEGLRRVLSEVQNENTYYYKGRVLADKGHQTDHEEWKSYDETVEMCKSLREDLELTQMMLRVNQRSALQNAGSEIYKSILKKIAEIERDHRHQLDTIRKECDKQLKATVRAIKEEHEQYNAYMTQQVDVDREEELERAEERLERAEKQFQSRENEEHKMKFNAARLYLLLKKHNLLTGDENLSSEEDRAKTADIIDQYQSQLDRHDTTILWLRGRISQLEELTEVKQQPQSNRPPTTASIMLPPSSRASFTALGAGSKHHSVQGSHTSVTRRRSVASALLGTTDKDQKEDAMWGVSLEEESEEDVEGEEPDEPIDEDLIKANALEQLYEQQISDLTEAHALEIHSLEQEHTRLAQEWEIKLTSLLRLHDEDHMTKVARRQERLLKLAVEQYRPRPPRNVGVQVYLKGVTVQMMREEERRVLEEKWRAEQMERERKERLEELEKEQRSGLDLFKVQGKSMRMSHS
ncbi:hypothetical protein HK097_004046, partial [Rhizophlyctis rosea]